MIKTIGKDVEHVKKNQKNKKDRNSILLLLLFLVSFGLGLGYAYLTQQLSITNTVNYGSMKWNVGFTVNGIQGNAGSVLAVPVVSADKKTITITCDLGTSLKSETCIVKAPMKNDSTFDIKLSAAPKITINDEEKTSNDYIASVTTEWAEGATNTGAVAVGNILGAGKEEYMNITITTKQLSTDLLPSTGLSIKIVVTMDWVEASAAAE